MEIKKSKFSCKRDELIIRGLEYKPEGANLPIFIVCHGFTSNYKIMMDYARLAANMGFAAYCFDFCGGSLLVGTSDGKSTDMSVLTEIRDLNVVIEYVKSLSYTDSSRIVLMGHSMGGLVCSMVASERNDISKLILLAPAFMLPDDARKGDMLDAKFDPENIPNTLVCGFMRIGKQYVEDMMNIDAYQHIQNFSGDVLILYGNKDERVPYSCIRKAAKLYRRRIGSKTFLKIFDGLGHRYLAKEDKLTVMKPIVVFLKNFCKTT